MYDGKRKIELLAPARDLVTGCAAINFGADAVYIGGPTFGARVAAGNPVEDIARLVRYAHGFGARVYVTMNTILRDEELAAAEKTARDMIAAGADALIVQDMAFLEMGLESIELHASTQTQNISPERVLFLEKSGFSRVILERGLTLEEIRTIRAATTVELEAFVHGAICVGHSGRCYLSRSMSPRSGNRGDCAQPCRMTYDLIDGNGNAVMKSRHLLSLRDLNLSGQIPALLDAGITSFKIEGRLKEASYVKNIVAYYRQAIDKAIGRDMERSSDGYSTYDFTPDPAKSFSRGFTTYYLTGKARGCASFDTPKAIGEYAGRVIKRSREEFVADTCITLHPGDGICFVNAAGELAGTNINSVEGDIVIPNNPDGITAGTELFRNYDHRFSQAIERSRTSRTIDIKARVCINETSVSLILEDGQGNTSSTQAEIIPDLAREQSKMEQTIRAQVSKSGKVPFAVTSIAIEYPAGNLPFIPVSQLNALRREAMERLWDTRCSRTPEPKPATADDAFPYPFGDADCYENVTNALAERFYRRHGVEHITAGLDFEAELHSREVMRTPYCIRREIGQCLREGYTLKGPLTIRRGNLNYRLEFDCAKCEMKIIFI